MGYYYHHGQAGESSNKVQKAKDDILLGGKSFEEATAGLSAGEKSRVSQSIRPERTTTYNPMLQPKAGEETEAEVKAKVEASHKTTEQIEEEKQQQQQAEQAIKEALKKGVTGKAGVYDVSDPATPKKIATAQIPKQKTKSEQVREYAESIPIVRKDREARIKAYKEYVYSKPPEKFKVQLLEKSPVIKKGAKEAVDFYKETGKLKQGKDYGSTITKSDNLGIHSAKPNLLAQKAQRFRQNYEELIEERIESSRKLASYAEQQKAKGNPYRVARVISGTTYVGLKGVEAMVYPFIRPKETIIGTFKFFTPTGFKSTITQIRYDPAGSTAQFIGGFAGFKVIGKGIGKSVEFTKSQYVKLGAKYVPPEKVFAPEVLEGKVNLPTTKSVTESLQKFNKPIEGDIIVQTSSPAKIAGKVAGAGRKGGVGLEDPGIYVTPKGKGSPYFLRIGENVPTEYTFNPVEGFKQTFGVPTVTEFKVAGVKTLPRSVVKKPGFESIGKYFENIPETTEAFITKRSEIGTGNIPRQTFVATTEFELPMKGITVRREGQVLKLKEGETVKAGDVLVEAGTSELEAIVPKGTQFTYEPQTRLGKIKGFEQYTKFEGKAVAIRKAKIASTQIEKLGKDIIKPIKKISKPEVKIAYEKVLKESSYGLTKKKFPFKPTYAKGSTVSKTSQVSKLTSQISKPVSETSVASQISKLSQTSQISKPSMITSVTSKLSATSQLSKLSSKPSRTTSKTSKLSKPTSIIYVTSKISGVSSLGGTSGISTLISEKTPPPYPTSYMKTKNQQQVIQAFDVLVKRRGEWKPVAKALPKGRALQRGAFEAKRTLAATFKIEEAGFTKQRDISFRPSPKIFRPYIIRKGKKIKTPYQFIQKTKEEGGSPFGRLASKQERVSIHDELKKKSRFI